MSIKEKKSEAEDLEIFLKLIGAHEREEVFDIVIKYITKNIKNAGCSIFLVDPMIDQLCLVKSSHIPEDRFNICKYERGKGFTGWTFKYKQVLYIPDENDLDYINKICPEDPPRHAGKEGGKCVEIEENGPFMAVPISSNNYIMGVIRICSDASIKKEFSKAEQKVLSLFSERLSELIISANLFDRQKKLIHMYSEIGAAVRDDNTIEELLNRIVVDIPYVVGGGGCSIFLHNGEKTENGKKKFILSATNSSFDAFKKLKETNYYYEEGGPGLTSWIATTGIPVKLNDISDKEEIKKLGSPMGYKPIHQKSSCEIENPGPFLAVPISESIPIGVIRIPRHKGTQPFEDIDKQFLSSLADHLSLTIEAMERKETLTKIRNDRTSEFERMFSNKLIEKCQNISKIDYSQEIKEFLEFPKKSGPIDDAIMENLSDLWCRKYGEKYNFPILEGFKEYEKMLFELPRYRDHFIHQYQVFLLGAIIIDEISAKSDKSFQQYYYESLGLESDRKNSLADIAWLVASTFHDVAYPVQKSEELFNNFFKIFMGIEDKIVERIGLEKISFNPSYSKLIDQLCDLHYNIDRGSLPWKFNSTQVIKLCIDRGFRESIYESLIKERDHGVLGALILLYQSEAGKDEYSTMTYPAALAIAMHNKILKNYNYIIEFEKNPLTFLLAYCDLIQEWGRGEKDSPEIPTLNDIQVNLCEDKIIEIDAKVRLGSPKLAKEKREEAKNLFGKLKSNHFRFKLEITNTGEKFVTVPSNSI